MRRSKQEISERVEIDEVIRASRVCRLGLCDGEKPYVVPLFFGYDGSTLYFHCAPEGMKLDILHRNNRVCAEFDILDAVVPSAEACSWSARYRSVIAFGVAEFLESIEEKQRALELIMAQYGDREYRVLAKNVDRTTVVKVTIDTLTRKRHG